MVFVRQRCERCLPVSENGAGAPAATGAPAAGAGAGSGRGSPSGSGGWLPGRPAKAVERREE